MIEHSTSSSVSAQKLRSIFKSISDYIIYVTDITSIKQSLINKMLNVLKLPQFNDEVFIQNTYDWIDSLLEPIARNSASLVKDLFISATAVVSLPVNDVLALLFSGMSGVSLLKGIIMFDPVQMLDNKKKDSILSVKYAVQFLKDMYPDKATYIDDIYEKSNIFNYIIKHIILKIMNSIIEELNKTTQLINDVDLKGRLQQFIDKLNATKEINASSVGEKASLVFFNTLFGLGNKIESKTGGYGRRRSCGRRHRCGMGCQSMRRKMHLRSRRRSWSRSGSGSGRRRR